MGGRGVGERQVGGVRDREKACVREMKSERKIGGGGGRDSGCGVENKGIYHTGTESE